MPTLANIDGRSLAADLSGLLRGVEQVGERFREESKLQELEDLALTAQGQAPAERSGPLDFLSKFAPDVAKDVEGLVSSRADPTVDVITNIDNTRAKARQNIRVADTILSAADPVAKTRAIREDAERVRREGGDVSTHVRLANMSADEQDLQARKIKMSGQGVIRALPPPTAQEREIARIKLNVRAPQAAASLRAAELQRFNIGRARQRDAQAARDAAAAAARPSTELGQALAAIERDVQSGAITPELGQLLAQTAQAKATQPEEQEKTTAIRNFELAKSQGFEGDFFDFQKQLAEARAGGKPITDAQAKAAGFAERMISSNEVLSDPAVTAAGLDRFDTAVGDLPIVGGALQSEAGQRLDQAKRDFVNAILRRESGAVISQAEFDNAEKQYFPQPGDKIAKIKQKAKNRELAIKGVVRAAGPAAEGLTAQSEETPGGVIDAADFFK